MAEYYNADLLKNSDSVKGRSTTKDRDVAIFMSFSSKQDLTDNY